MAAALPGPKIRIAMIAVVLLMLSSLYTNIYNKHSAVSGCSLRLAQLELLDERLDRLDVSLNAAAARRNGVKR
jgi:hypothetical protein